MKDKAISMAHNVQQGRDWYLVVGVAFFIMSFLATGLKMAMPLLCGV